MPQPKTVHVISHTHWDREWYLPYEKHHVRLVKLMDTLLETLERDADYRSFHLDGQTIMLEDYVQIRPEKKTQLERFIAEGRIHIGPWYILQDEFLTSSEANARNLLIGHRDARAYGAVARIGYFPDSFGNVGQAPQLLRQADIGNAIFGRGVKPTGFNNEVIETQAYESPYSEMFWEAPDGSRVLGILFANWYSNGNEIPAEAEAAQPYWDKKIAEAARYASTPHLLLMNGCDHQPVQTDLPEALRTARKLYPDLRFVHAGFEDYVAAVAAELPEGLSVIRGELRSQHTDGWSTLVNTASSRVYIKQMNQRCQALLEKAAEPLAALAHMRGTPYPHHLLTYAWKTLMQNHPHDSICGCSVDEVHREMVTRFDKSRHVAEAVIDASMEALGGSIDTSIFEAYGSNPLPIVAANTTGWSRTGVITAQIQLARGYFRDGDLEETKLRLRAVPLDGLALVDPEGHEIPFRLEDKGIGFGYDLPEDRFRQPYFTRSALVTFEAANVPALGYKSYALVRRAGAAAGAGSSLLTACHTMENGVLSVTVEEDGSLSVKEIATGHEYRGLGVYENTGDIGNEYMYRQPPGDVRITTRGVPAEIRVAEDTPFRAAVEIVHRLEIPASGDELLDEERREMVWFTSRRSGRSSRMLPLVIRTLVSLERNGKGVSVQIRFDNQAKDHRLRVLFPTGLASQSHYADSVFEVVERPNSPSAEWRNPSNCQHQQAFVSVADRERGITIANRGLNEYEILGAPNAATIAVTLLRATGELGDWGVFPTPEAQCIGEQAAEYLIIPHSGSASGSGLEGDMPAHMHAAIIEAYQYQAPWTVRQTEAHAGELPAAHAFFAWSGEAIAFSSLKIAESSGSPVMRWYNLSRTSRALAVRELAAGGAAYRSDILERRGEELGNGTIDMLLRPAEIITIGWEQPDKEDGK